LTILGSRFQVSVSSRAGFKPAPTAMMNNLDGSMVVVVDLAEKLDRKERREHKKYFFSKTLRTLRSLRLNN